MVTLAEWRGPDRLVLRTAGAGRGLWVKATFLLLPSGLNLVEVQAGC
jgi:hypothetical protein